MVLVRMRILSRSWAASSYCSCTKVSFRRRCNISKRLSRRARKIVQAAAAFFHRARRFAGVLRRVVNALHHFFELHGKSFVAARAAGAPVLFQSVPSRAAFRTARRSGLARRGFRAAIFKTRGQSRKIKLLEIGRNWRRVRFRVERVLEIFLRRIVGVIMIGVRTKRFLAGVASPSPRRLRAISSSDILPKCRFAITPSSFDSRREHVAQSRRLRT